MSFKQQSKRACHSNNQESKHVKIKCEISKHDIYNKRASVKLIEAFAKCQWRIQEKQSSSSKLEIKSSSNQASV